MGAVGRTNKGKRAREVVSQVCDIEPLAGRVQYIVNTHSNISIKNLSLSIFSCSVPSPMCFEMPV